MENYIVSARKYRPTTFDTVVGQTSITSTLKNAIKNNHLAQSFLFCGPRGIGKTTCARIFAKTINCENLSDNLEPCNKCESCNSFNNHNSFNIHELDAASNNSVEDIRALVEQVRIPPRIGKYKIYIIDEVHMLSQAAFNAFLKTLEEPPAYAKFVLATTEKHKIIPTILSRCQIFDFKRISVKDMAKHLKYVAENENINAEPEALHQIAQKADGALRDALSIFDQIVSFSGNDLTYQAVIENLNVLDYDYYFKITDSIINQNTTEILLLINEIIDKGFEGQHFIAGFGQHLRNLLVSKNEKTAKLLEVSDSIQNKYIEQAKKCQDDFLINSLEILSECDTNYKITSNKTLQLELTLLRIASYQKKKQNLKKEDEILIEPPTKQIKKTSNETDKGEKPEATSTVKEAPSTVKYDKPIEPEKTEKIIEKSDNIKLKKPLKISDAEQAHKPQNNIDEEKPVIVESEEKNKINEEEVLKCWDQLTEEVKDESHGLHITLKKNKPKIEAENNKVIIELDNKIQESDLQEQKPKILNFLKKKLNNSSITISTEVSTNNQNNTKAYLPEEKFKQLSEKNPALLNLKQKLNLDFY